MQEKGAQRSLLKHLAAVFHVHASTVCTSLLCSMFKRQLCAPHCCVPCSRVNCVHLTAVFHVHASTVCTSLLCSMFTRRLCARAYHVGCKHTKVLWFDPTATGGQCAALVAASIAVKHS
eukprot:1156476-Pelagomonas_calceolata.AAC.5